MVKTYAPRRRSKNNTSTLFIVHIAAFLIIFTFLARTAHAAEIMLAWDQNPEQDIAGYKIHYGLESDNYATTIDVGNYTTCVLSDLETGQTYYFAATAYNTAGEESDYSNEISHTVSEINQPPTADAGPDRTVNEGDLVTLNGSNSFDPDNGIASFQWTQIDGPPVTPSGMNTVSAIFTAPDVNSAGASLVFELVVTDNGGLQSTDRCIVNVAWENEAPTADAGSDQTVTDGTTVYLNGSGSSDPDDGIASYQWTQTTGPAVNLTGTATATPTFIAPSVGPDGATLVFQLTVADSGDLLSTDTCIVNVTANNDPPVADAGSDQTVYEGSAVNLDGTHSYDPDDDILIYRWKQVSGDAVLLSDPTTASTTFRASNVGPKGEMLTFELTVTDSVGLKSTDTCSVTVNNVHAPPGLNKDKTLKIK